MKKHIKLMFLSFLMIISTLLPSLSLAGGLIRDAEIERVIRNLATPIFQSAGLVPEAVKIFIVDSPDINAYVAGGSNIFIHTGLLMATDRPEMLVGVLAHETGHIAGGHLASGAEQLEKATIGTVLSVILGAAAAAGGGGEAGMAIMSAGQQASTRGFLAFNRANEQFADQAALGYLEDNKLSADGMLSIFEKLRRNEKSSFGEIDPYSITHPLSKERIAHIRHNISNSPFAKNQLSEHKHKEYDRILAKLKGFLETYDRVLRDYPISDKSANANYARAVAYYRNSNLDLAISEIDTLLNKSPNNAYYHELKGQIWFENGKLNKARESYMNAIKHADDEPLLYTGLAQVELSLYEKDKKLYYGMLDSSINNLNIAAMDDKSYALIRRLQIKAYGLSGDKGEMYLATAEAAMLDGDAKNAKSYSQKAMDILKSGTSSYYRANDLLLESSREVEKNE